MASPSIEGRARKTGIGVVGDMPAAKATSETVSNQKFEVISAGLFAVSHFPHTRIREAAQAESIVQLEGCFR
jgi:hypothetical protein